MSADKRPPTDSRRTRKRGERQILLLIVATLVFVGGGLIAVFYGFEGLLAALPCLLGGAGILLVLYLVLVGMERWANR
jgi:hypothetical protein